MVKGRQWGERGSKGRRQVRDRDMTGKERNKKRIVLQQERARVMEQETLATARFEKPLWDILTSNKAMGM